MKNNNLRRITIITLCIALMLSLSGCAIPRLHIGRRPDGPSTLTPSEPIDIPTPTQPESDSALPEYYHYDAEGFYDDCEEMLNLYDSGKTDEAFKRYRQLNDNLLEMDELQGIAYIKYSENVNDDYYSDEYTYANEILIEASDAFFSACHEMIVGAHKDDFRAFLNDDVYADYYLDYEPMNEEQIGYFAKENELVQQYYTQADTIMDTSCTIDGQTYTFEDVIGDNSEAFYSQDADLYLEVYETCLKKYNAMVGETFLDLVDVRTDIAKSFGYDNYADYADVEIYEREYVPADLEIMKLAAKDYGEDIQDFSYMFSTGKSFHYNDSAELVGKVGSVLTDISPIAADTYDYFWNNHLYSIGNDSGRMDGGYTIYLSREQIPYIYIKDDGTAQAAITLAHEFGHFTAFHQVPMPYPTIKSGSLDLEETHSQGLQLLFTEKAKSLFGRDADQIRAYNVARVASAVVDGCVFDDWQREVYANPDMTLDEINDAFRRIEATYGASYYPGLEYLWCDVSHNFDSPMYYVSYAISALGALQIWAISKDDYQAAVAAWESLIEQGPYDDDYTVVMQNADLKTFYDEGAADSILYDTTDYLEAAYFLSFMS